ncbi:L-threonylcarbamoyladenylate synthase [Vibrio sp. TH_r3]|uniref:L-threonylcarbamoyladenylate synthase n=1 Tax=unclassified Vibrio TaxID=2614977 RepID=UPI0029557F2A|nr:L-threonylcarbamoyladenylate synthase [Vibrio sp. TH_r3]MDV7105742.1 L-threonylcarbamoyladenylate synthase [Vibrio sp. TH_r3]
MTHFNQVNLDQVVNALHNGDVIAYPTEGVFGVGCDPDNEMAVKRLLQVKNRSVDKGLILIAASYQQVLPYIDESKLTKKQLTEIKTTWPGPVTWVMPVSTKTSKLVTGKFNSVAVRVTDHPLVKYLCTLFDKPITSTSANLSGMPPCMTTSEVRNQLGQSGVVILSGETGGRNKPSEIRDAVSGKILRQG